MVMSHLVLPRRKAWSCVFSQEEGQGSRLQAVQVGRSQEEKLGSLSSMFLTSWRLLFLFNSILLKVGLSIPCSFFDVS